MTDTTTIEPHLTVGGEPSWHGDRLLESSVPEGEPLTGREA
jgi:hypothetical protein